MLITLACGLVVFVVGWPSRGQELLRKEAVAIVGLSWIGAALFGSLPYMLADTPLSPVQAVFEATSGFTTTGSTVIGQLEVYPSSILFWRNLTQWVGGLGILALLVALMAALGVNRKSLLGHESSLNLQESPTARVKGLVTRLWLVYCAITLVCWLGLMAVARLTGEVEMDAFNAFLYTMTTVATGGFAPHDASVGHFDNVWIEAFLCLFMVLSSLSMILVYHLVSGRTREKAGREEAVVFIGALCGAIVVTTVGIAVATDRSLGAAFREVFFPCIAIGTTTGYATVDYDGWPLLGQGMLIMLMLMGGCSGSTAGGLKMVRVIVLFQILRQEVVRSFRPNLVSPLKFGGHTIPSGFRASVLGFISFNAMLLLGSALLVSALEPGMGDFSTVIGAVLATAMNIGPGFGEVGPTDNYAHLGDPTLLLLSCLMLLGRLEIYAVTALFTSSLWRRY
jgi:trk system potassium uptake protein TrkH